MTDLMTLRPSQSVLNGVELYEPIDYDKLMLIMKSNLLKTYDSKDFKPYENEITHLKKYVKNYNKKLKAVKVKYVRGDVIEYGRVNPEHALGLHCLKKQVRHTIANGLTDIDIVNCHPVILLNICKKYNYPCDHLETYVNSRERILNDIINVHRVSRDKAKELVIILTYLGSYDNWLADNELQGEKVPFLVDFYNEMNVVGNVIKSLNKDLAERLASIKDKHNINSIMSYYLQTIESYILEEIFLYCRKKRIINKTCVLSNDGIMIPSDKYKASLLADFKKVVKEKFDLDIDFETKPMDKGFTTQELTQSITNDTIVFMGKTFNRLDFEDGVMNDMDAVKKVLSVYNDFVCVKGKVFGFDRTTGMWGDGCSVFKDIVIEMDDYLRIKTWNEKKEDYVASNKSYANTHKRMAELKKYFVEYLTSQREYVDDNFFERNANSSKGCLLFKNGILKTNWETKTLEFVEGFDKSIVFASRIDADYIPPNTEKSVCDYEDIDEMKKVFFDIFGEQQDYFIEFLATAIFGLTLKHIGFVIGESNAGKSTLLDIIIKSFTSDVIGSFDIRNFLLTKHTSNDASKNRWILLEKHKRLLVSSESIDGRLDAEYIKQVASGGKDQIVGRLHQGNETSFVPNFMLLTMLNSMPCFNNVDDALKNRLVIFKLEKKYVDAVMNPLTDMKKLTDEEMYEYKNEARFIDAFRWVIINAYETYLQRGCKFDVSDKLKAYLDEVVTNNVDDGSTDKIDMLMELFDFTGDDKDKVKSSDVITILETHRTLNYLARNNRERKHAFDKCAKECGVSCNVKVCKISGKTIRCYIGIKTREHGCVTNPI